MVTDTAFFRNPNYHRPSDTADKLARLSEHAAKAGVRVSLEFGAFTTVRTLDDALEVLERAGKLPTDLLRQITFTGGGGVFEKLTRREYALICCGLGAALLALLPLALHYAGTRWTPGVPALSR